MFISTDADPVTGAPLVSKADGRRHRELYRGVTRDSGATWTREALTANSDADNLLRALEVRPPLASLAVHTSYSDRPDEP